MIRKGCLLRTAGLLIIFVGIAVYLFDKYGREFYETSKERIYNEFISELENKIFDAASVSISDSIKNNFMDKLASLKEMDLQSSKKDINKALTDIKNYIDSNSNKIKNFDEILKMIKDYEQAEKN